MSSIIVAVGPSGAGKSTLCNMLIEKYPDTLTSIPSVTTRQPREYEVDGVDYHFTTSEMYLREEEQSKLICQTQVISHKYGLRQDELISKLESGYHVIIDLDVFGLIEIKRHMPQYNSIGILILPSSIKSMNERLVNRNANIDHIKDRTKLAQDELSQYSDEYDDIVINIDIDNALSELSKIYTSFIKLGQQYQKNHDIKNKIDIFLNS